MRASLSSFLLTSTSSEDSSRFNRTDKSPSKSCCGDTASNSLLTPPQNGLLFIGYCAHWARILLRTGLCKRSINNNIPVVRGRSIAAGSRRLEGERQGAAIDPEIELARNQYAICQFQSPHELPDYPL
ncbi:uncharacterized protein TNCV_1842071 [Trichonephila clavipes]|nr:uncharacterized protein TNCV_1842071 [Trichonephila clavipes]